MGREGRGIGTEGKREAIVSGTHTGVGLDSFIGCAVPHAEQEEERKEAGSAWTRDEEGTRERREKVNGNARSRGGDVGRGGGRRKREPCVAQFGDQWEK